MPSPQRWLQMSAGMMQSQLVSINTFWFANEIVAKD